MQHVLYVTTHTHMYTQCTSTCLLATCMYGGVELYYASCITAITREAANIGDSCSVYRQRERVFGSAANVSDLLQLARPGQALMCKVPAASLPLSKLVGGGVAWLLVRSVYVCVCAYACKMPSAHTSESVSEKCKREY